MTLGNIIPGYGPLSDRPNASQMPGGLFNATDIGVIYTSDGSTWDAITVPTSATFLSDYDARYVNESDLTVTLGDYTLLSTTASISGDLQNQINQIVQESTSIVSSGGSILISQNGTAFNLEVLPTDLSDYTLLSTTASISGDLQTQITYNTNSINNIVSVTGDYLISSDLSDYTLLSTTASISGDLQSQIDALSSGGVTSIEGLTGVVDISGGAGIIITTAGNSIIIHNNIEYVSVPASPTATGIQGQRAYSSNYVYECIATNTWVRYAAASSWL